MSRARQQAGTLYQAPKVSRLAGVVTTALANWTIGYLCAITNNSRSSYSAINLSLSFNPQTTGVNGMDTGGLPSGGTLYIYAIYNPTTNTWGTLGTIVGSGSLTYQGSSMPTGYTASVLIHTQVTVGTVLRVCYQVNNTYRVTAFSVLENHTVTTETQVTVASIPANAISISGSVYTSGGNDFFYYNKANGTNIGARTCTSGWSAFSDFLVIDRVFFAKLATSGTAVYMKVDGYCTHF